MQRRSSPAIRALPVILGMVVGAVIVAAAALGVGLLYLHTDQLEFHAFGLEHSASSSAPYEAIFFQYLFPGVLLGELAGGLIGRVFGRPRARPPQQLGETIALSA
jgi:CDP-diglyceride synthetase